MAKHQTRVILAFTFLGFAAGCGGGSNYTLVPVSGKVTCKGVPVAKASIVFAPVEEGGKKNLKNAEAVTSAGGDFVLTTVKQGDGAIVGKHKVTIIYEDAYKGPPCTPFVGHLVEVKEGPNNFEFELSKIK